MALTNLPQPDTTSDGKTSSRWMFLLWQWVINWSGTSTNNIIGDQVFLQHPPAVYPSLNAVDSQNILANQIFGG